MNKDLHPYGLGSHSPFDDVDQMPPCHPIKGNRDSMKYHRPDSTGYEDTKAEVWFVSPSAAEAAGFELAGSHPEGSNSADYEPGASQHPCGYVEIEKQGMAELFPTLTSGAVTGGAAAAGVTGAAGAVGVAAANLAGRNVDLSLAPGFNDSVDISSKLVSLYPFGPGSHRALDSGEMPSCYIIKGNADSMKYHRPDSSGYEETIAEVWFLSPTAAEAAGFELAGSHPPDSHSADFEPGAKNHPCGRSELEKAGLGELYEFDDDGKSTFGLGKAALGAGLAGAAGAAGWVWSHLRSKSGDVDTVSIDGIDSTRTGIAAGVDVDGVRGVDVDVDGVRGVDVDVDGVRGVDVDGQNLTAHGSQAKSAKGHEDDGKSDSKGLAKGAAIAGVAGIAAAGAAAAAKAGKAGKAAGDGAKAVVDGVGDVAGKAGKAVGGVTSGAVDGVGKAGKAAGDGAKAVVDGVGDVAGKAGKAVGGVTSGAVDGVGKAGKAAVDGVGKAGKAAVDGVGGAVGKGATKVGAAATAVGAGGSRGSGGADNETKDKDRGGFGWLKALIPLLLLGLLGWWALNSCGGSETAKEDAQTPVSAQPTNTSEPESDAKAEPVAAAAAPATATAVPEPTATAVPEPTATAVPEPTTTAVPEPTATPVPEPTAVPAPEPGCGPLGKTLQDNGFATVAAGLGVSGITSLGNENVTLFAPTESAFSGFDREAMASFIQDPAVLKEVLGYHIVKDVVEVADLEKGWLTTEGGRTLAVRTDKGDTYVNSAAVRDGDIVSGQCLIHPVDKVLVPPTLLAPMGVTSLNAAVAGEPISFVDGTANFTDTDKDTLGAIVHMLIGEESLENLPPIMWTPSGDDQVDAARRALFDEYMKRFGIDDLQYMTPEEAAALAAAMSSEGAGTEGTGTDGTDSDSADSSDSGSADSSDSGSADGDSADGEGDAKSGEGDSETTGETDVSEPDFTG